MLNNIYRTCFLQHFKVCSLTVSYMCGLYGHVLPTFPLPLLKLHHCVSLPLIVGIMYTELALNS